MVVVLYHRVHEHLQAEISLIHLLLRNQLVYLLQILIHALVQRQHLLLDARFLVYSLEFAVPSGFFFKDLDVLLVILVDEEVFVLVVALEAVVA